MKAYNAQDFLNASIYGSVCSFNAIGPFLKYTAKPLVEATFSAELVKNHLNYLESSDFMEEYGQSEADYHLRVLIAQDASRIRYGMTDDIISAIHNAREPAESLQRTLHSAIGVLNRFSIDIGEPKIRITNKFPEPYNNSQAMAMNIDEGDCIKFGMESGLYFKKNFMKPLYSEYLLCHELIHTALGQRHPEYIARGIEEGFCELLGAIYIFREIYGSKLARNMFLYNRYNSPSTNFFRLYVDYTRQASWILREYGWSGLAELVRNGRPAIKWAERKVWEGAIDKLDLPKSPLEEADRHLVDFLLLVPSEYLVVTASAYRVFQEAVPRQTTKEIAAALRMSPDLVTASLAELEGDVLLLKRRLDGNVVAFSDAEHYRAPFALRYLIPRQ